MMDGRKMNDLYKNQPIMCPWITGPSSNRFQSAQAVDGATSPFFYFLRLMQLFPDTHPATLHTVLTLCENNFFSAVDKLLYAKHCKSMYNKRQQKTYRTATPYQKENFVGKTIILQSSEKINSNMLEKCGDDMKTSKVATINSGALDNVVKENKNCKLFETPSSTSKVNDSLLDKEEEFLVCEETLPN